MREPWFRIIDVTEKRGRSIADIAHEVASRRKVSLREIRGDSRDDYIAQARRDLIEQVKRERPDLSSARVADFLHRDPSSIRKQWRKCSATCVA